MRSPRYVDDCPDDSVDCEVVLEAEFEILATQARAAGWSEEHVATALLTLAVKRVRAMLAHREGSSD